MFHVEYTHDRSSGAIGRLIEGVMVDWFRHRFGFIALVRGPNADERSDRPGYQKVVEVFDRDRSLVLRFSLWWDSGRIEVDVRHSPRWTPAFEQRIRERIPLEADPFIKLKLVMPQMI